MRLPVAGIALLALAGCGQQQAARADAAWVRLPAVAGRPGAAYFTLSAGQRPLTLLSVRTPAALRTELHESRRAPTGVMSMVPIGQVDVAANGSVKLAPGGKHVMLFDMNPAMKAGGKTMLTLAFADGTTLQAPAVLRGAGEAAP